MFLNHVDERRSAVIAVRSDSPSGSGVRLEPHGDRFGRQHESFAVRHRLTDQQLVAGPLRAAKSHAQQPDSIDSRCQRHDHDESVLSVFACLVNCCWQPGAASSGGMAPLRGARSANASITLREVFGTSTFWLLAGSFFVCNGTANGLIGTHLIPHEIDHGIPQVAAASLVGVMGGLNFVGTVLSGWMIDRVQPRKWLAMVYALRGLSLLILPFVQDFKGLFVFAVIYGLDWFATVPPTMAITADTFGKQNIGKIYGWIFMSHQIGAAIMAWSAGALRTWMGDYQFAFLSGGVIAMIAAGLALQIKPKPQEATSATVAPEAAGV